ncbi:ABC transporter permease [Mameliella alba]|uniref:ABC transporter permease n=1 Tax=Mameliella alba TaxID=561184 RepID=A0A0B3S487_9RHOB|nr:ABC transporter permease [Mameliella alba]KHQ51501.1 ABC transporter permease [Mameliella alba]
MTATLTRVNRVPGLLPGLTFLIILVLWETSTRVFTIPTFLLPAPSRILEGFDAVTVSRWLAHAWATLRVAMLGFLTAIVVSLPLAIALTRFKLVSSGIYPLLVVIQSTPIVAVAPIIIVTMGSGDVSRVLITFMISFFPLVVSMTTGMKATPDELMELSHSLKAPAIREFTQIRIPYAIPYIFSGLKISVTLSVIGAVVAEFVAAEKGIGYFIQFSTSLFKIPQAWAGLGILVLMSLTLFQIIAQTQRYFFPWSLPRESK